MPAELQTIFAASLNWLAVFVCASLFACAIYRYFRPIAALSPVQYRSGLFLIYAVLPALVATAVSSALYFPVIADLFLPEHCHGTDCSPHAPLFAVNAGHAAVSAAVAIAAIGALFYLPLRKLLRHQRNADVIERLSTLHEGGTADAPYIVVENKAALAWCDGLFSPRIFVSRGLLERVNAEELEAVLAHEYAHAARRDNLVRVIIDWMTRVWPARSRQEIRDDFSTAAEHACDHLAAQRVAPAELAEVMRKLGDSESSVTMGQRIEALHEPNASPLALRLAPSFCLFGLCLLQAWVFARAAHPVLEWIG